MKINTLHQPSLLNFVVKAGIMAVFVTGSLILVEWITGLSLLNKIFSYYSPMKLITAILLVLSSLSLWIFLWQDSWRKQFLRITGGMIILVSILTLLTYLSGNLAHQNDYMLFNFFLREDNRMAFVTSLIFFVFRSHFYFIFE